MTVAPGDQPTERMPSAGEGPGAVAVVWAYRRTGKFAFHVLTGAIESAADLAAVPVEFANGVPAVIGAVESALGRGHRVLVGWSFYSPDSAAMAAELRRVRDAIDDRRVLHVAGGVHASAEPLATLRAGWELVATGDGERLIVALVRALRDASDPRAVPGVAWLADGELRRNGRAERAPLDEFPPFGPRHRRHGPIEITRGCIYACRFCQTPHFAGAAFRHRSVANVRHWVRYLVGCGFRDFRFLTPTSLSYGATGAEPDLAAVEELLAGVREDIGAGRRLWFGTFPSEVRPEHVTPASLQLLRRYVTNRALIIGGQSGSDAVLARSARGHDAATVERAARLALEHGFVPHVDYLFGLPGEGEGEAAASLAQMERLVAIGARVHGHTFLPLPGTPFRRAAAGRIDARLGQRLQQLAAEGVAYGQWQQQQQIASALAQQRDDGGGAGITTP